MSTLSSSILSRPQYGLKEPNRVVAFGSTYGLRIESVTMALKKIPTDQQIASLPQGELGLVRCQRGLSDLLAAIEIIKRVLNHRLICIEIV